MPGAIQINAEWLGNSGWYVHVIGPHGARERRRDILDFEQLIEALREDVTKFGAAILPSPPATPPAPFPQPEARHVRHAPKADVVPPIPAPEPVPEPRVALSKRQAALKRVAADEAALGAMSPETRDAARLHRAQAARRR